MFKISMNEQTWHRRRPNPVVSPMLPQPDGPGPHRDPGPAEPGPPHVVNADGILGRIHVWSETEWVLLTEAERPFRYEHVPGLGWVGLLPAPDLNN
jgi:hypothetical protein